MDPAELRVGDAERDQVMAALHEHFAQGRLTQAELEERVDTALSARTAGDLSQVTSDLPQPAGAAEPVLRGHHRHGPPLPLIVVGLLVVSAFMAGPWWPMFVVVRLFALVFVITALMGFRRRARFGRRWGGPGGRGQWAGPGGQGWGGPGGPGWQGLGGEGWGGPGRAWAAHHRQRHHPHHHGRRATSPDNLHDLRVEP
jgi:Domain of unknown function (DUF1707)